METEACRCVYPERCFCNAAQKRLALEQQEPQHHPEFGSEAGPVKCPDGCDAWVWINMITHRPVRHTCGDPDPIETMFLSPDELVGYLRARIQVELDLRKAAYDVIERERKATEIRVNALKIFNEAVWNAYQDALERLKSVVPRYTAVVTYDDPRNCTREIAIYELGNEIHLMAQGDMQDGFCYHHQSFECELTEQMWDAVHKAETAFYEQERAK